MNTNPSLAEVSLPAAFGVYISLIAVVFYVFPKIFGIKK